MKTFETMPPTNARAAVRLGLLRFPPNGTGFPGRKGRPPKPYVVDARGAGALPGLRRLIVDALKHRISNFGGIEAVAGLATSGMIWGALVAEACGLPYATIRLDGPRPSGLRREIEGEIRGLRTILVDNWIRSGESLVQAALIARREEVDVAGTLVISGRIPEDFALPILTAFPLGDLERAAVAEGRLDPALIQSNQHRIN
ncbi:MAG: hypothetical protein KDM63_13405 [Verrucomicrobiae bacterium]|nr:hypothetical protein [Verrucomicrobiae bacterium]